MTIERMLRLIGGLFVLVSAGAGMLIDSRFLWVTLFVGANLFQSGFTGWCPMMTILQRAGFKSH